MSASKLHVLSSSSGASSSQRLGASSKLSVSNAAPRPSASTATVLPDIAKGLKNIPAGPLPISEGVGRQPQPESKTATAQAVHQLLNQNAPSHAKTAELEEEIAEQKGLFQVTGFSWFIHLLHCRGAQAPRRVCPLDSAQLREPGAALL